MGKKRNNKVNERRSKIFVSVLTVCAVACIAYKETPGTLDPPGGVI